jgi:hypothetical protein
VSAPSIRRSGAAGAAIIAVYLVAALTTTGSLVVRPLYDGGGPVEPYRWVKPPPDLAANNQPPEGVDETFPIGPKGSEAFNIAPPDQQFSVTLPPEAIRPKKGETKIRIVIRPLDPSTIGEPPPRMTYDGNAYEIRLTYATSGEPAPIDAKKCPPPNAPADSKCMTILMRYPIAATAMLRRGDGSWETIETSSSQFTLIGDTFTDGIFVAALQGAKPPSKVGDYVAIGAGAVATLIAIAVGRIVPQRRRAKARAARAKAQGKRAKKR